MNYDKIRRASHGFGQSIGLRVVRGAQTIVNKMADAAGIQRPFVSKPGVTGHFQVQCLRPDGTVRWEHGFPNGVVNEGLDRILNTMFDGTTQIGAGAWYLGLIDASGFTALAAGDTYASHSGWSEATQYDEATRGAWNPAASTAQSSSNTTTVDFTMNATKTIYGIFLASVSTKGDSTSGANNVLWATGQFPGGSQAVVSGDVLKITYTINAAAA